MYTITKEYHFSSSHQLAYLPDTHPCSRMHGHNYIVEVELQAEELNENGFVFDYRDLDPLKKYIDDTLDHRHLNDVLGDRGTSAEQIAKFLFDWCKKTWPQTTAVRVRETPKTCAEYRE